MSPSQNKIPPEIQVQIDDLKKQVKRFEDKGLFDTAHHEILENLLRRHGLIPAGKTEVKKDVNDGK